MEEELSPWCRDITDLRRRLMSPQIRHQRQGEAMAADWEHHKDRLRDLYLVKDVTLKKIMILMRELHDFDRKYVPYERFTRCNAQVANIAIAKANTSGDSRSGVSKRTPRPHAGTSSVARSPGERSKEKRVLSGEMGRRSLRQNSRRRGATFPLVLLSLYSQVCRLTKLHAGSH